MIHVLALLARAGHGKTTIANYFNDEYGVPAVSLAAPLKRIAKIVMNFSDAQLYGTQEDKEAIDPRYGMSARIFLQKLGTEGIREHLGPLTWCEALLYNIKKDSAARGYGAGGPADLVYVVDDARFINEIEFVHDLTRRSGIGAAGGREGEPRLFGTVIKLVCTDAPPSGNDNHPSEREVDLVPPHLIDAVVTSSRALGTEHLIEQIELMLNAEHLANLRGALHRSALAKASAERVARLDALRKAG
jgi:hypothetical protein